MDEIINKLLESNLLSEETKKEITSKWEESVAAYKKAVKEEVTADVIIELKEQFAKDSDELAAKMDALVTEVLKNELAEFEKDVLEHRDVVLEYAAKEEELNVEFAKKVVEEKHRLAEEVAKELDTLVEQFGEFIDNRLNEELKELHESIEIVKRDQFGRKIMEAFSEVYESHFIDEDSLSNKLKLAESKIAEMQKQLSEEQSSKDSLIREAKLEKVLSPLSGKKREQMSMILKTVETGRLEESFNHFIGKVLKTETAPVQIQESVQETTTIVTGNDSGKQQVQAIDLVLERALINAGIKKPV